MTLKPKSIVIFLIMLLFAPMSVLADEINHKETADLVSHSIKRKSVIGYYNDDDIKLSSQFSAHQYFRLFHKMMEPEGYIVQDYYSRNKKKLTDPFIIKNFADLNTAKKIESVHGEYVEWYPNGSKKRDGEFVDGVKHNKWNTYYPSQKLKSSVNFINGKREGATTKWYENGQVKEIVHTKNNRKDGIINNWYENGQIKNQGTMKVDRPDGLWRGWYRNGKKKYEGYFSYGRLEGLWTIWHNNGSKKQEGFYRDSFLDGLFISWHENGRMSREMTYIKGNLNGIARTWYDNGQLETEAEFKENIRITPLKRFSREGVLLYERKVNTEK